MCRVVIYCRVGNEEQLLNSQIKSIGKSDIQYLDKLMNIEKNREYLDLKREQINTLIEKVLMK
ncbi:MAG: hypothetical protein IKD77_04090 [Bacilli bacterium]|nr:hypothetical protein [Bacilli bacterium]